jgi:ribonucleoside-triphosphate reductase
MNINIKTAKNFATQLNKLDQEYGEEFRKLQGLDEDKLNLTDFIDNFIDTKTVADASVDASSNIAQKDIVILTSEMSKPQLKLIAFNKLYYEIQKFYGFKTANKAFEYMWNYSIYMHDFHTSTLIPYCFAYDIKDIVEKGLFFIENYNNKPPKHLDSFVQILMEAICFLARRQSGAVGLPNLIPYMYYFWSRDVANGYYTKDPETYKKQQIQALIYRLNQPWVRSDQSAFTNVSVFDHPYFEAIFGGSTFPDGSFMIDEEEEIIQFQKDFIDVVNKIRALVGPHDPEIAKVLRQKSLRAIFGVDRVRNVCHCTDLPEDGVLECQYMFELM